MPKVRTLGTKKAPKGFDLIEDMLNEFQQKMRDAENEPHDGKRRHETVWPILRIHHQRSRYIYELYYREEKISRELYEWLLREKYADAALIAKWKKPGFERLCCVKCIQTKDTNYGTTCICRVPRGKLEAEKFVECKGCGCRGCSSGDQKA